MTLTLYRRHKKTCPNFGKLRNDKQAKCNCKIWADGIIEGREVRMSLDLRDWSKAERLKIRMEDGEPTECTAAITLAHAWTSLLADLEARKLSNQTVRKYKLLKRQMEAYGTDRGLVLLAQFNLDVLSRFRATWKDGPRTASKKLERLRAFFRFAHDRQWVETNPATRIRLPKVSIRPTMPLTNDELVKILTACDGLQVSTPIEGKLNAHRLKTLILLMRYTGMRVSDAVMLTTDRLDGKRLFLYTQKTGVPVYTVLPDSVLFALEATPRVTDTRYFWSGNSKRESVICHWQMRLKKVFDLAGISKGLGNAVSHRLRDTFAVELLLAGVPIERVSILLGHQSVRITEKHYSPWVRARQEQLEADVASAWKRDPILNQENVGTNSVHLPKGPVN
jgi:site-specific recombinase XerD